MLRPLGRGREYVVVLVDLDSDTQRGDPGETADRLPEGLELPVLLGLEGHGGQLLALGIDRHGRGDRLVDQVAIRQQAAAGCGAGGNQVEEFSGAPAQNQSRAAVILPASDVDTVVQADLADGSASSRDKLAEFSAIAYRKPDVGQVRSHAITIGIKRAPRIIYLQPPMIARAHGRRCRPAGSGTKR